MSPQLLPLVESIGDPCSHRRRHGRFASSLLLIRTLARCTVGAWSYVHACSCHIERPFYTICLARQIYFGLSCRCIEDKYLPATSMTSTSKRHTYTMNCSCDMDQDSRRHLYLNFESFACASRRALVFRGVCVNLLSGESCRKCDLFFPTKDCGV